jgi:DNA invertase Pin-like site-specific DNA recombinase
MERVWLYCRSYADEDESLAKQRERLSDHVRRNGCTIIGSSWDTVDGMMYKRRFNNLNGYALRNQIDTVLVTTLSVISPDYKIVEKVTDMMDELGVDVIALDMLSDESGVSKRQKKIPYPHTVSLGVNMAALTDCPLD